MFINLYIILFLLSLFKPVSVIQFQLEVSQVRLGFIATIPRDNLVGLH